MFAACMPVYHVCVWRPRRPEKGIGSPETRVTEAVSHRVDAENETAPLQEDFNCRALAPSPRFVLSPSYIDRTFKKLLIKLSYVRHFHASASCALSTFLHSALPSRPFLPFLSPIHSLYFPVHFVAIFMSAVHI